MAVRSPISDRARFEVFKRDSFKCQYCGASAPEAVLHVDHIQPVSKGGGNDITNLITACKDCNMGKSNIELDDNTAVMKQKKMLDEVNERRQQLEMIVQWREQLETHLNEQLRVAETHLLEKIYREGHELREQRIIELQKHLKKYGLIEVLESIDACIDQYVEFKYLPHKHNPDCWSYKWSEDTGKLVLDGNGNPVIDEIDCDETVDIHATDESLKIALDKLPKVLASRKKIREKPYLSEFYYARGILKKRFNSWYPNYDWQVIQLMEEAFEQGLPVETIKAVAKKADYLHDFKERLETALQEA